MRLNNAAPAYWQKLEAITAALRGGDVNGSRAEIAEAMAMEMDAPEPHNLLGILYELTGDYQTARKHYRAAYALDPTYAPSCRNLERITGYDFRTKLADVDFGTNEDEHAGEDGGHGKRHTGLLG